MTDLIKTIKDAGVAGMGGAGFPSYLKADSKVKIIIANGAECEPLMWSDYYAMSEYAGDLMEGLNLLKRHTGAQRMIIAVKAKKKHLVEKLESALKYGIEIFLLEDYYPAGDEIILVNDVLGITIPERTFPVKNGVLVNNAATIINISRAFKGYPVTKRFVTVTGEVNRPFAAEAPLGISFTDLLKAAGGSSLTEFSIMESGVMMGRLADVNDVVCKTTSGIVVLPPEHPVVRERKSDIERHYKIARSVCDQCYACSEVCPRLLIGHRIEPHKIMRSVAFPQAGTASDSANCCLCGLCSLFACPMGISPRRVIENIRINAAENPGMGNTKPADPMINLKRIPMSRLLYRMGLEKYERNNITFLKDFPAPESVRLMLRQHRGEPAVPVVKKGEIIKAGDVAAKASDNGPSLPVHCSITGAVSAVNADFIEISVR